MFQKKIVLLLLCYLNYLMELNFELNKSKGGLIVTGGKDTESKIVIPSEQEYDGRKYPVTEIGECAMDGYMTLKNVIIPDSVSEIGALAFYRSGLVEIELPESIEKIGEGALVCPNLKKIISHGFNYYSNDDNSLLFHKIARPNLFTNPVIYNIKHSIAAVANASVQSVVTIPSFITKIEKFAFAECDKITEIVFHDKVSEVEESAFYGCCNLKRIIIKDASLLENAEIPKGVEIVTME